MMGDIIMNICCGEGFTQKKVWFEHSDGKAEKITIFESIAKLIYELNEKVVSPLRFIFPELSKFDFSPNDFRVNKNLDSIRAGIREIIETVKTKHSKEEIKNMGNLLSVLLTDELYT
jgi:hypothetical protein